MNKPLKRGEHMKKKIFVLDTNVLLHDPQAIFSFDDNDLLIPIIVLEELDQFKKGVDWVNQSARSIIRTLSKLSDDNPTATEIQLGKNKGKIIVKTDGFYVDTILSLDTVDNKLLALCLNLKTDPEFSKIYKNIVFVTKDINLRMKARALKIEAQDYENDKVIDLANLHPGYRVVEDVPSELINQLYSSNVGGRSINEFSEFISDPIANEYFVLKNGKQSAIVRYNKSTMSLEKVLEQDIAGIRSKNLEQILATDLLLNQDIPLVALTGTSGAGKTLLALAAGISQRKLYTQIYLARPIVPVGNDIGFLPGDINEKIAPYMQPLWDNLDVIKKESKQQKVIEEMVQNEKIKVAALPYLRGRSLPRIYFIIDEIQNLTPHEIKTIVTRAGEGTKIVLTGDIQQIDSPYLDSRSNGLSFLIHKMKDQELFGHIKLQKGERSKLAELASNIL